MKKILVDPHDFFKPYAKKLGKDQNFSKNIFAQKTKATKNIDRFENISWSLPFYPY